MNCLLLVYIIQEMVLVISAVISNKKSIIKKPEHLPKITIQLPLYNEPFVAERLLNACFELDYIKEFLEIQILDDSTDETSQIIKDVLVKNKLISVHHIQRENRAGFKAGALAFGLESATGEFVAVFDADFIPQANFLQKTIPHFSSPEVGVVQTRWGHINENTSLLTRAQAIMLNTHFSVEQLGRSAKSAYINFNGTAGVWRKTCIDDAGGWEADTLTEDLDLSYRAQIKNWKFKYLFDVETPAELPITFDAFKTQQFRWSKGAAECVRKNWSQLWRSSSSFGKKVFGSFHLLNSSIYFLVFLLLVLSPLVYYFSASNQINIPFFEILSLIGSLVSLMLLIIFFIGYFLVEKLSLGKLLWFFPSIITFFTMTSGISIYMASGVLEGYIGKKSPFIRTPKIGESKQKMKVQRKKIEIKMLFIHLLEFFGFAYGGFLLYKGFEQLNVLVIIYGFMLFAGFSLSLFFSKFTWRWAG